jgi:hypothetical protein
MASAKSDDGMCFNSLRQILQHMQQTGGQRPGGQEY